MSRRATTGSGRLADRIESLPGFRKSLQHWYGAHGRELPWRKTRDPYAIWVSEVMLQQTRVETVIPYYDRFLSRFPTVEALAEAPEDEVLAQWSGLGYYSRARNLRHGASIVRDDHGGRFPEDPEAAGRLPGVGPYTRAAILSIAYEVPLAVVDGNVARVLARIFRLDVQVGQIDASMRQLAQDLLQPDRPAEWNQAMMELGARICTPRQPSCTDCPVRSHCHAAAAGDVLAFPRPKPKRQTIDLAFDLLVLRDRRGRLLLERGDRRLLPQLWLPPLREVSRTLDPHGEPVAGPGQLDELLGENLGRIDENSLAYCGRVRHSVTHHRIEARVWKGLIRGTPGGLDPERHRYFSEQELESVARSSLLTKALREEDRA